MFRYALPLAVFMGLIGFLWLGLGLKPGELPSQLINKPVPKFIVPSLADPRLHINDSIFNGKISLLNVWSSWCTHCVQEHQVLLDLKNSTKIQILGLNYKDNIQTARDWLDKHGDPYHQIMVDQDGSMAINWGVYGTPETFIIDQHGTVRYRHAGALTTEQWKVVIEPLIDELTR